MSDMWRLDNFLKHIQVLYEIKGDTAWLYVISGLFKKLPGSLYQPTSMNLRFASKAVMRQGAISTF